MRARSALFDVYGGHLRARGGAATVAALVRLLEPLGFAAPAVRTAVSRTVRQGWLKPVRLHGSPGYALTPRAERRLDEAGARIYRTRPSTWDGQWHMVVLEELVARPAREELTSSLKLLGYGELGPVTWVAPRASAELAELLGTENIAARTFFARHEGSDVELAARAWDLAALGADYEQFVAEWEPRLSAVDPAAPPAAFAATQELLHAWRKFLFRDPGLPPQLLPADWPGHTAARFFDSGTQKLAKGATEFLDSCLD